MKHFLLIITLFTSLCAAAIEPIVSESKEWYHYRTTYIDGNLISRDSLYSYVFDGVEEVNGVEYHKLIINDNEPYNTSILMRQDGGKTLLLTGSVINIDGFSEEFEKEFPDYDILKLHYSTLMQNREPSTLVCVKMEAYWRIASMKSNQYRRLQ